MVGGSRTYRLAIATFDRANDLWAVLNDLIADGFSSRQFSLIGTSASIDTFAEARTNRCDSSSQLMALFTNVETLDAVDVELELVASASLLPRSLLDSLARSGSGAPIDDSLVIIKTAANLLAAIKTGAVMLIVSASSPEQLLIASRELLKRSQYAVQTIVFRWPSQPA